MRYRVPPGLVVVLALLSCKSNSSSTTGVHEIAAVVRSTEFLTREVHSWRRDNGCYSCHNNGDAAQAVYAWHRATKATEDPIAETTAWLHEPKSWSQDDGESPFKDEKLARLQFAAALFATPKQTSKGVTAAELAAAQMLVADQTPRGAWQESDAGSIGSPITYGPNLATAVARGLLLRAGAGRFAQEIERADRWLRTAPIRNVVEASGVLLGISRAGDAPAHTQRTAALQLLRRAQAPSGGFGPFADAAPEAFDTALASLALATSSAESDIERKLRAHAWLRRAQLPDGSWRETTRPPGATSYAHWISTTAWAVRALLAH